MLLVVWAYGREVVVALQPRLTRLRAWPQNVHTRAPLSTAAFGAIPPSPEKLWQKAGGQASASLMQCAQRRPGQGPAAPRSAPGAG